MDPALLARFVAAHGKRLRGATVQRVVCVADGLVLEVRTRRGHGEVAVLGPRDAAWAYSLHGTARATLHAAIAPLCPELVAALPVSLGLRLPGATALDALRAWLVRPVPAPPPWLLLEGATLCALRAVSGDRRLWLEFERQRTADTLRLTLLAELFDRSANFLLHDATGCELANWSGRRPAPEARPRSGGSVPPQASQPVDASNATAEASTDLAAAAHVALAAGAAAALARAHRLSLQRQAKRLQARLTKLEADAARAAQADAWRRQAELLSANLHRVQRGQGAVEIDDLFAPGTRVTVELDPRLLPHENVALLFKRARRGERGQATVATRLAAARAAWRDLAVRRSALPDVATATAADWSRVLQSASATWQAALSAALARADARTLWAPGGPPWQLAAPERQAAAERAQRGPGRTFLLPGNWEVRVGRSNIENDELTHRFAHADDIWLHASGTPGSHVVLRMQGRKGNPPRAVLEAAAAIAARFSQAKHARTVPVVWTRKRYVRKPRGGAAGLATCTHEKTLFVRPGLPAGQPEEA